MSNEMIVTGGELLAIGEKARKRGGERRDELTPQERQIAQLAVQVAAPRAGTTPTRGQMRSGCLRSVAAADPPP